MKKNKNTNYKDLELKNKIGVYQIRNIINDKVYVGSSKDIYKRKKQHFSSLIQNKHENNKLQKSFNKYGLKNFKFEVLETLSDIKELINTEQYWIDKLNSVKNGYNIQPFAGCIKITEDIKQRMIENHADFSGNKNPSSKSVVRLEDGVIYSTMKEACENNNIKHISSLCLACYSKNHIAGKYHWLTLEDYKKTTKDNISKIINKPCKNSKKVICNETGIVYNSIKEANRKTGIGVNIIAQYIKNTRPKHLKDEYTWRKYNL